MADFPSKEEKKAKAILHRKTTFTSRVKVQPAAPAQSDIEQQGGHDCFESQSSYSSEDLQGYRALDPDRSVLLRFECISALELKVCNKTSTSCSYFSKESPFARIESLLVPSGLAACFVI